MKKLCILSDESVLGGGRATGIAEVVDSLAYSFSQEYDVNVVTIDGPESFANHVPETIQWIPGIRRTRMFQMVHILPMLELTLVAIHIKNELKLRFYVD